MTGKPKGGRGFHVHPLSVRTNDLGIEVLCYNACGCPVNHTKKSTVQGHLDCKSTEKGSTPPHLPSTLHVLSQSFSRHCCLSLVLMGKQGKQTAKNNTKKPKVDGPAIINPG